MPRSPRRTDVPPLFGPNGRIPAVQAVAVARPSRISVLRSGWLPRHTLAMLLLTPALTAMYLSALSSGLDSLYGNVLSLAMALLGALVLTTYLPLRGAERASASSCALMPALMVPGTAILLHQASGAAPGALALAVLALGLWQRLSGTSACRSSNNTVTQRRN